MFVAQSCRHKNVIQYILYMWNVEDLIRANHLNMKEIEANVISGYKITDEAVHQQVYDWWDNLCEMMRLEKCEERGHVQVLRGLSNDIYNFHLYLLTQPTELVYQEAFKTAWPDLSLFMTKIPGGDKMHHIDVALIALYDFYLLKLQGKTILADTMNANVRITAFLNILSDRYLKAEKELEQKRTSR